MSAVLENSQSVRAKLEHLQMLLDELRGEYVNGINGPDDYDRATQLLDELTDGHELNAYEERILIELEGAIQAYEDQSEQFQAFNAAIKVRSTPVQLLKDLMETLKLTGSDLPEVGDKTVVSKVLKGERQISHKMAFALAERFGMNPKAFAPPPEQATVPKTDREHLVTITFTNDFNYGRAMGIITGLSSGVINPADGPIQTALIPLSGPLSGPVSGSVLVALSDELIVHQRPPSALNLLGKMVRVKA
jgi:HTH-type transcriptional regulator/antitoxin HigA